jgi:hypothetical protein
MPLPLLTEFQRKLEANIDPRQPFLIPPDLNPFDEVNKPFESLMKVVGPAREFIISLN